MRAVLIALCLMAAAPARADEEADRARARDLKNEGAQAFERGEHQLALEKFRAAHAAYPSANLRFNVALALAKLGRDLEAVDEFERFLDEAKNAPEDARAHARSQVAELERKLGRIEVNVDVADPRVTIDGIQARPPVRAAPGRHAVLVEKAGYRPLAVEVNLKAGETERVAAHLVAIAAPSPAVERPRPSRLAPILVGAGALALVATGAGLRISAGISYDDLAIGGAHRCAPDCTAAQVDPIRAREYAGYALLGVGAAVVAVDVVLWILDARARRR